MSSTITVIVVSIFFFFFFFISVEAQSSSEDSYDNASDSPPNSFQPSLAVVIGMLSVMLLITFILLLYAKLCHHRETTVDNQLESGSRSLRRPHVSGIDRTVIESLPFFRFSSLKGSRQGLECSVCLAKFESIEILRLLPKCRHAFHIGCIDRWLKKHSTCPLCRHKVTKDDFSELPYSNSLRFLWNSQSLDRHELHDEESNVVELYVQREENVNGGSSSRFSVGSSFRESRKGKREEELPIQNCTDDASSDNDQRSLHRFNHRVVVSDVVFKKCWSNVSSASDRLVFLNSEIVANNLSGARFSALDSRNGEMKFAGSDWRTNLYDRRSMSEILVFPRLMTEVYK